MGHGESAHIQGNNHAASEPAERIRDLRSELQPETHFESNDLKGFISTTEGT